MSGQDECPNCNAGLSGDQRCHKCGWPELFREPELVQENGSEIEAVLDTASIGLDNIKRPVHIAGNDGELLLITVADAKRLLSFLNEAIPFLEQQAGMRTQ